MFPGGEAEPLIGDRRATSHFWFAGPSAGFSARDTGRRCSTSSTALPPIPGDSSANGLKNTRKNPIWSITSLKAYTSPPRLLSTVLRVNFDDHWRV